MIEQLEGTNFSATFQLPGYWKVASSVWVETVKKMCASFRYDDAPWEYLERTNSAILAGSLTASGAQAMPETYVMRNGATVQQAERVDICVVMGIEKATILELVECKLAEYDASRPITANRVASRLRDASRQVKNITGIHGIQIGNLPLNTELKHTAVVIGLPCFQRGTPYPTMTNSIQEVIKALRAAQSLDLAAWCFPEPYLRKPSRRYGNKSYAGTFLAEAKVA